MSYGRLLSIQDLMDYTSLGKKKAAELGEAAGAKFKWGSRTLYDRHRVDEYIERRESESISNAVLRNRSSLHV